MKEFIAKPVLMVSFNLVLFAAILCWDESFSCLNKLLKWLCVSQKSSGQPWRYDAQTSFQKKKKKSDRSIVNSQLPCPGDFRLSRPWTWAKASCFQQCSAPENGSGREAQLWGRTGLPKRQPFQRSSPEVSGDFLSCAAVWGSPYPILWLSFLSVTRARNLSQLEGFYWIFLPPLPSYALWIFFPNTFFGHLVLLCNFNGFCFPKELNWRGWHWKQFMVSVNKVEFGNRIICHLPVNEDPSPRGIWIMNSFWLRAAVQLINI